MRNRRSARVTAAARMRLNRVDPPDGPFLYRLATPLSLLQRPVALRPDLTIGLPCAIASMTRTIRTVAVGSMGVQLSSKTDDVAYDASERQCWLFAPSRCADRASATRVTNREGAR